jgi:putative SOS response-associated peptidase YedK
MIISHWMSSARVILEDAEDAAWFDAQTTEAKEALRLSQERK